MTENNYLKDILNQETDLRKAIAYYRSEETAAKLRTLTERKIKKVVFSGMGSSHFCAYGADIMLKRHGITSQVISTGELIYYESEFLDETTLLCLISQSGESAETVHLLEQLDGRVFAVGITNHPESTLARLGNLSFLLHVPDEASVTTRTYMSSLILVQVVAAAICGEDTGKMLDEYEQTLPEIGRYLKNYEAESASISSFFGEMHSVCLMGRGNSMSSVRAGALFLREVARIPAVDFDSAEFRHGPMEMVQEGFCGIVFAPAGKTGALNTKLAEDIAEKNGRVMVVTDQEGADALTAANKDSLKNMLLIVLPGRQEDTVPLLQILPVQLFACAAAEVRGIEAGVFRWGSKVMGKE